MKQLFYLLTAAVVLVLSSCSGGSGPNTLTDEEKKEGWILMFDGETTDGWREYDAEAFPDKGWSIEDGSLKCSNSGMGEAGFGGDIMFDKQFTNFHFKVDWMIEEGGNSGIFYSHTCN